MAVDRETESDLIWFFCEADGACGVRSQFGAQLERARQKSTNQNRKLCSLTYGMSVKPEKMCARASSTDMPGRALDAARRASAIAARLRRVSSGALRVLEAQYSTEKRLPGTGVSLGLLSIQPAAIRAYKTDCERRESCTVSLDGVSANGMAVIGLWLLVLAKAATKPGPLADMYGMIVRQAEACLNRAIEEYES